MIIISKNKGFLVILYFFGFFVVVKLIDLLLVELFGGSLQYLSNEMMHHGIILLACGCASIYSDKHSIRNGSVIKEEFQINELFFIKMELWGYALIYLGALCIIGGILEIFAFLS